MQRTEIFPWSDNFATGIAVIDEQHRQLVELLNQLACHLVFGSDAPTARTALAALTAYASYHFRTEEGIWAKRLAGDPLEASHRGIHEAFKSSLADYLVRDTLESEALIPEILAFLTRWLANHILQCDRHLAAVVLGLERGQALEEASSQAAREMEGTADVLRDAIVALYAHFSTNSLSLIREIESRRLANEALVEAQAQLRAIIDSTFDLVWSVDAETFSLTMFNQAFADYMVKTYGVTLAVGMPSNQVFQDERLLQLWTEFYHKVLSGGTLTTEYRTFTGSRHLHLNLTPLERDGAVFGIAIFGQDITERKAAEASIHQLAFFDPLTNLPNRRLLQDRLRQALAGNARRGGFSALLVGGLDNFKRLNDVRGHSAGDQVLLETARRLGTIVRGNDTIARLGSDEFIIILNDLGTTREAAVQGCEITGQRILESIGQYYQVGDQEYQTTMSLGVCLFHRGLPVPEELLQNADTAMHEAKRVGKNALRFFDPAMKASLESRVSLEGAMRSGFPGQFLLHYQPQIGLGGRILGAEALARWQHPERGMVSPGDFIPLAEETGLILGIGTWVLRTACAELKRLEDSALAAHLQLAVNVSAKQFAQPDFVDTVLAALRDSGADPRRLKLELTESMLMFDVEDVIAKMSTLKAFGVTFALDDFGTGFSSLSALKRLPLDQLKIDQSFVRDIQKNPNDAAIARTVIALGQSLGLAVIAEGVETQEQLDFLASHGCTLYQGYFFSRPLPRDQFEAFLGRGGPLPGGLT